jgi:predicted small metal-binding protein
MLLDGAWKEYAMHAQFSEDQRANYPKLTFRCRDLRIEECTWQTTGHNESEVLSRVQKHFREEHGFTFDLAAQTLVRQAIRKEAA